MATPKITTGILKGEELQEKSEEDLRRLASSDAHALDHISFYKQTLRHTTFRGVTFETCGFAKSLFESVTFRKCTFKRVDLIRSRFINCYFSDCQFLNCDPYYASFKRSVIDAAAFKKCYDSEVDVRKGLLLFSRLRRDLLGAGDSRRSRAAEYYYRTWERKLLYSRWRSSGKSGATPWALSLTLGWLTGYGERPIYVVAWIFALITVMGAVYRKFFPFSTPPANYGFWSYWYFSFKIFCAKGFTNDVMSAGLLTCQVTEFMVGILFLALLVGSVTRKLS